MADERVVIKIDVKADTRDIDKVRAKLAALCAQADSCKDTFGKLGGSMDEAGDNSRRLSTENDRTSKSLRRMSKDGEKVIGIFKTGFKFAMIGSAIETAALAVALSSVNGLLATGRFLVKGYHVVMSGLAKAAAAAGVALATVAAAQRQYIAAQATGRYGGNFAAASTGLRTLTGDARLASLGMKALTGAFVTASKNAKVSGGTASAIAGLMDFAVASGDIEKGASAVANLVSLVQKGGAGGAGVLDAAKQLGPEFEKAFKEASRGGKATSAELMKMFSSGELAQKAGLAGGFAATKGSLVGQLKAFMTEMQVMFGDLGTRFIEPVQFAFEKIRQIMVRTVTQLMPVLTNFAQESLINKIVAGIDKISQFVVKLVQDYVPKTQDFFQKVSAFWDKLTGGFEKFNKYLRGLSEASKVINTFFGKIFRSIGGNLKDNFEQFSNQIVKNEDNLMNYGDSISRLIDAIFKMFRAIRDSFFDALPAISRILDMFSMFLNIVSKLIYAIGDLGRIMGSVFGASGAGSAIGGLAGYLGPILALGGLSRVMKGKAFFGGGMKKMGSFLTSPLGMTAVGVLGTQALTNRGNTAVETTGDIATGALVGASLGKFGLGVLQKGATNAYVAGQGLAEAGGRFAGAGSRLAGAATTVGSMSAGQVMGAGALLAGGAVATHVGSNLASDAVYRASGGNRYLATATGATTGALTGAATGAALTAWLGPGALGGAIVGGIIGSIWGGVNGLMKDSKYKKQARKAAQQFVDEYAGVVEQALGSNDIKGAKALLDNFNANAQAMADTQVKSGTAMKEAAKQWETRSKGMNDAFKLMGSRFSDLERISGMTTDQVRELANSAEVDLGSGLLSLKQILEATGIATVRFGEDFNRSLTNSFANAVAGIQQSVDILNAPQVINEAAQSLREQALSDTLTTESLGAGLQAIMQQQLLISGGDPLAAYEQLTKDLGVTAGGGGQFNTPGNVFYDPSGRIKAAFQGAGYETLRGTAFGAVKSDLATLAAENIIGGAAGVGMSLGISKEALVAQLSGMGESELIALSKTLRGGPAFTSPGMVQAGGRHGGGVDFNVQLANLLGGEIAKALKPVKTDEQKTRDAMAGFGRAVEGFRGIANDQFGEAVGKFQTAVDDFQTGGDTSSPRRNIVNTLGAHSRFDSMIAGSRTVTSGYRTWGLGSMSSDHAAGRAYDLTGQNLGLYQMAVKAGGGFAEFHGTGGGRHLHVVPNTSLAPIGDMSSPYSGGRSTTGEMNNMTVNMTVNAAPGMDTVALANEVMAHIDRAQRSIRERR